MTVRHSQPELFPEPSSAPRAARGRRAFFEKLMGLPKCQLISQEAVPVHVVSLSHDAELKAHVSTSRSVCGPMEANPCMPSPRTPIPRCYWSWRLLPSCWWSQFFQRASCNHRHRPVFMRASPHWHHGPCEWPLQSFCLGFTRETSCSLMRTNRVKILSLPHNENYADSEGLQPYSWPLSLIL